MPKTFTDGPGTRMSFGNRAAAALAVLGTMIGIAAGVHGMVKPDPVPEVVITPAPEARAFGTVQVPAGLVSLYAWSAPSLQSTPQTELQQDDRVEIECTAQGQVVDNGVEQSSLWNYTKYGYIPDVYLYTGSSQAKKPACP